MHAPGGGAVPWHSPTSGRALTRNPAINIKQKISQWEGRNQQQGSKVGGGHAVLSRTQSDGSENANGKPGLAKAKSLGLDFREACQAPDGVTKQQQPFNGGGGDNLKDIHKVVSSDCCPQSGKKPGNGSLTADACRSLPPGSFYTSRGFWKKMDLPWQKEVLQAELKRKRERPSPTEKEALPVNPPPKPQRTFQYLGERTPPGQLGGCILGKGQSAARNGPSSSPLSYPPPSPEGIVNGITRGKPNRKSFEFEDAERLNFLVSGSRESAPEGCRPGLYHALSEDNIYEDIICESRDPVKENAYEDVNLPALHKLRGAATPKRNAPGQRSTPPKLPPKPASLFRQVPLSNRWRAQDLSKTGRSYTPAPPAVRATALSPTSECKRSVPRPESNGRTRVLPRFVSKIQEIFNAKRGKKRVKTQVTMGRGDASDTESDTEEPSVGGGRRSVHVHSTLRRNPLYQTLEKDLYELQEQQLFQLFVVVSLRKKPSSNAYTPEITQQFPNKFEKSTRQSRDAEQRLRAIPSFCFPDSQDWRPSAELPSETFSFVLTGEDGGRWFGYCRKLLPSGKGKRIPEVHCIVSRLGCFNLFAKILEEVERRRDISPALVYPFMRSVMEAPFPAPGRTITVKNFLPGSGNEVLELCRPVDSRLEHVDFDCLLQCLGGSQLLQVFASLLLERRVIFVADKLSTLSRCAHAAIALLYPFTWQHTYIPVLPACMIDITCSPTPFLIGVLSCALPELMELPIEEVLIVDLCANRFIRQISDEDCILPSKLQAALLQVLEERGDILALEAAGMRGGPPPCLSSLLSEAFVHFFVELVGHYSLHMGVGEGGQRALRRDAFRKSHPSRGARQFLQLFMETQTFSGFIQDRELRKSGVKGLFELRAAEYLETMPDSEPGGMNKFLKGLGNKMKFLQKK
ncbi:DENN domain-containing protein 2C-like isoform X1 [Polyodon spathula]|uniref:DENN domain-containing protein 2C-like isoform X1 n=1 Tax=Polyodon spathula TaxID=7913 RepID=UPI001B7F390B|nr:DENN domain-containing protein 2C-like isoform X1 [Polyodon spathula]